MTYKIVDCYHDLMMGDYTLMVDTIFEDVTKNKRYRVKLSRAAILESDILFTIERLIAQQEMPLPDLIGTTWRHNAEDGDI